MAPSRILVTGGTGFVGQWLSQDLKRRFPASQVILAADQAFTADSSPPLYQLDVRNRAAVDAAIRSIAPQAVVHLAAISAIAEAQKDPEKSWDVNLNGTRYLAEAVLSYARGARFIYVSSSEVYGGTFKTSQGPLNEGALLDPANSYAASKAAADLLIGQLARDGLNAIRLRPFNHTGSGQTERFVIPAFARQIARIEKEMQAPLIEVGDLDPCRDFLDVRDVVAAYSKALIVEDIPHGMILNIASGIPRRIGDVLEELINIGQMKVEIRPNSERVRRADIPVAVGDAAAARDRLGWSPKIPWRRTLEDILDHWRTRVDHGN